MGPRAAGIVLAASVLSATPARAETDRLVFLGNPRAGTVSVSSGDLRRIYLGQITRWPNRRKIVLAVRPAGSPAGRAFFRRVVGMTDIDFSQLWLGIIFRGEAAIAPRVEPSRTDVTAFLRREPGGLAFLLESEMDTGAPVGSVLEIDGKRPADPGYAFDLRR
jgi:hypothetical protein